MDETAPFDEVPNSIDDDGSYRNIVFSSVDKVTDLLKMDDAGAVFSGYEKELLKVLENGLMSAEPDGEYERKYGSGEDGPVSLALNTIRPRAIEGLSRWAFHFSVHSNVRSALDSLLCVTPAISDSKADAAAFGLAVPWLVSAHLQWVTLHRSEFFGAEKLSMGQQIALDVVLTYYSVSAQMLSYLKPAFKNALSHNSLDCVVGHRLIAHSLGWSIGNWLYQGVALEYIESDDSLVELWESRVGANVAWDVVEHLCAILSNSGDVGEAVVGRVGNLWDRCFERYGVGQGCGDAAFDAISRLALSGFFDNAWWGHRMLSCIQSGLHKSDLSLIIDELLELSKSDSKLAFDIFDAFVNSSAEPISLRFAYEKLAIPILGRAIGLGDANYIDRARNCMDMLGAAGMTSLDVDVEKFLERESAKGRPLNCASSSA